MRVYVGLGRIWVDCLGGLSLVCGGKVRRKRRVMGGRRKDMSVIKEVVEVKEGGEWKGGVRGKLGIEKERVKGYVNRVKGKGWKMREVVEIEDGELEGMLDGGCGGYRERRMEEFVMVVGR